MVEQIHCICDLQGTELGDGKLRGGAAGVLLGCCSHAKLSSPVNGLQAVGRPSTPASVGCLTGDRAISPLIVAAAGAVAAVQRQPVVPAGADCAVTWPIWPPAGGGVAGVAGGVQHTS